jgi:Domain of unknown function (DUF4266)
MLKQSACVAGSIDSPGAGGPNVHHSDAAISGARCRVVTRRTARSFFRTIRSSSLRKFDAFADVARPCIVRAMKRVAVVLMAVLGATGCGGVKPWQREQLASRAMRPPFADPNLEGIYRTKVVESTTGGSLPGAAPGGGCGCSQ